jgi:FdhD protein
MQIAELYHNLECSKPFGIIQHTKSGEAVRFERQIPVENLMDVYVNEKLSLKLLCTPSNLAALILGHLYTEGMIPGMDSVELIYVCSSGRRARVFLGSDMTWRYEQAQILEVRSCDCGRNGVLGRNEVLAGIDEEALDALPYFEWEERWIYQLAEKFSEKAPLYAATRGMHSCLLMAKGDILYCCEDIGRHNALDKAVGQALIDGVDLKDCILFSSGRIPIDMIQKVIRSKVPVIASNSVPTDQAIALAQKYNVTLICSARQEQLNVFSDGRMKKDNFNNFDENL